MFFKLSSIASLAILLCPTTATDIFFHTSTNCGGPAFNAYDAQAFDCISLSSGFARSLRFNGIPSGAKGQGYSSTGTCSAYLAGGNGGTYCMTGHGEYRSANWFWPWRKLARDEPLSATRYSITFEAPGSNFTEVEIPAEEIDHAWELLEAENYEALSKYPVFVKV